jgi:hypothetical protein
MLIQKIISEAKQRRQSCLGFASATGLEHGRFVTMDRQAENRRIEAKMFCIISRRLARAEYTLRPESVVANQSL